MAKFNCRYQTPFCTTPTILPNQQVNKTMAGKGKSKRNRSVKGGAQSNQLKKKCSSKATNGLNNVKDSASFNATREVAVNPTINDNSTNEMNAINKVASSNATGGVAINPTVNNDSTDGMNAINNAAFSDATRGVAVTPPQQRHWRRCHFLQQCRNKPNPNDGRNKCQQMRQRHHQHSHVPYSKVCHQHTSGL
jgi:hypothetical protein